MVSAPTMVGVFYAVEECAGSNCVTIPQEDWWQYGNIKPLVGVGPYTGDGSNPLASPLRSMPGSLSEGFLFDGNVNAAALTFGPNPLQNGTSVPGWFYTTLLIDVSYQGESTGVQVINQNAVIDSGGLGGGLSETMLPDNLQQIVKFGDPLPEGTTIDVYTEGELPGTPPILLYSVTVGDEFDLYRPSVWTPTLGFNTGNLPFMQGPIYFSYTPTYYPTGPDDSFGGTAVFPSQPS